eukprot:tig00001130_g7242.t1
MNFNNICVFCGASEGGKPAYKQAAIALGEELARRRIGLVYGGGSVGLMGAVARTVNDAGGRVTGIIPVALMPRELSGESIGETVKVDSMHTRKAKMAAMSDAFIALPGGYGTLEELLESVTWTQLGVHSKPIGVLNVGGYYDHLLAQIAHSRDEGFISASSAALLVSSADPKDLIDKLLTTVPPAGLTRWLTENQL